MAIALAVASVSIGFWAPISCQRGGLIYETELP